MIKIDLHTHTNASDGKLSPEQLIDMAIAKGIKVIAITDHGTIDGIQKAIDYSNNKKIEVIPGIEIQCNEEERGFKEIHILGLFIDHYNKELIEFTNKVKNERIKQKKGMIKKLNEFGFDITFEEVNKLVGSSFGRPHIAEILIKRYPKKFFSVKDVFDNYLAVGKAAYVDRKDKIKINDAIKLIKKAKGISILAHPGVYKKQDAIKLIKYFIESKGQGIETNYPYDLINGLKKEESKNLNKFFQEFAKKHNLLQSGGSDFHGKTRINVELGQLGTSYNLLNKLKNHLKF